MWDRYSPAGEECPCSREIVIVGYDVSDPACVQNMHSGGDGLQWDESPGRTVVTLGNALP